MAKKFSCHILILIVIRWSLFLVCSVFSGKFLPTGNYLSLTVIVIMVVVRCCCCCCCSYFYLSHLQLNQKYFVKYSSLHSMLCSPTNKNENVCNAIKRWKNVNWLPSKTWNRALVCRKQKPKILLSMRWKSYILGTNAMCSNLVYYIKSEKNKQNKKKMLKMWLRWKCLCAFLLMYSMEGNNFLGDDDR